MLKQFNLSQEEPTNKEPHKELSFLQTRDLLSGYFPLLSKTRESILIWEIDDC